MDFKSPPSSNCPINEMDMLHLMLLILWRRVVICNEFGLDCMDLPLLATTPFIARNCDRDDVYKLFRRLRRLAEKLNEDIGIFAYNGITASLRFGFEKGNIYVHDGVLLTRNDCRKVSCKQVNNVKLAFMYLNIKLNKRNMIVLNVPDALVWLAKLVGMETVEKVLQVIHDYVEMGEINRDIHILVDIINMWGIHMDIESFNTAILPAKRSLLVLRSLMSSQP
jgi:hypothetical protein